jgi:hypothetical protein
MEFLACILGGAALMGCGVGLFFMRPPEWPQDDSFSEALRKSIARWTKFQRGVRILNNGLMMTAGGIMMATGLVGHGRVWMWLWMLILLLLLMCISLALVDALTSLSGYRKALPQAAKRALGSEHEQSLR